jgi:hypothetical protein
MTSPMDTSTTKRIDDLFNEIEANATKRAAEKAVADEALEGKLAALEREANKYPGCTGMNIQPVALLAFIKATRAIEAYRTNESDENYLELCSSLGWLEKVL